MHGYRLRKHAREYSWMYPMTNASIYPALHQLEKDGFVTHRQEVHNGRARKVYLITDAGRAELSRWLADPPAQDMSLRDEMLLKLSLQHEDTFEKAREWLASNLEGLLAEIDAGERRLKDDEGLSPQTRMVMEFGVEMNRLRAQLYERLLESKPTGVAI